jgi:hypothetical protein
MTRSGSKGLISALRHPCVQKQMYGPEKIQPSDFLAPNMRPAKSPKIAQGNTPSSK